MVKDGLRRRNFWVYDLNVDNQISGTSVNFLGNSVTINSQIKTSSNSGSGTIINDITAAEVISGGMWVIGSAASGTTPNYVAKGGKFGDGTPLGICLATTASGSKPDILTRGVYHGLVAEATINAGDAIVPGAGAAKNCVTSVGSGAAQFDAGDVRGICLMGGGSKATVSVYLY